MDDKSPRRRLQVPDDLEAENAALACVLQTDGDKAKGILGQLEKADFASQVNQRVFEHLVEHADKQGHERIMSAPIGDIRNALADLMTNDAVPAQFDTILNSLKHVSGKRKEFAARAPTFAAYYDASNRRYWIQNVDGGWIEIDETSLRRHLRKLGYSPTIANGCLISPLEDELNELQTDHYVQWAGSLAGHFKGPATILGQKLLIKDSPTLIEPVEGDWPTIRTLMGNMFKEQRYYVYGWLKVAVESLRARSFRPGQALAIAGERGCCKSFVQNHIITPLLGGRSAKPYRYMSGGSDFNGDLFGAEHLMIEDEVASTDLRSRRHFGSRIKDMVANETNSHHAKNRNAVALKPFWRVTISLNDEPENMMILPPIDESLADKVMLLRAHKKPLPMPTGTTAEREAFLNAISSELPAFLYFLLNKYNIRPHQVCERYGVTHYHEPDLMGALDELSPEKRLAEIIDMVIFQASSNDEWSGTAADLQRRLQDSSCSYDANRILTFNTAAGTYLARLAKKHPDRYTRRMLRGTTHWTIKAPKVV